jgi:hypothetical protein
VILEVAILDVKPGQEAAFEGHSRESRYRLLVNWRTPLSPRRRETSVSRRAD